MIQSCGQWSQCGNYETERVARVEWAKGQERTAPHLVLLRSEQIERKEERRKVRAGHAFFWPADFSSVPNRRPEKQAENHPSVSFACAAPRRGTVCNYLPYPIPTVLPAFSLMFFYLLHVSWPFATSYIFHLVFLRSFIIQQRLPG